MAIALPERATDRLVPAHERARALQEIVEIENGGGAFEGGVVGEDLIELIGQLGDQRGRDTAEDHAVAVIDPRKMAAGLGVELGAAILAGGLVPRRLRPWGQQIERVAPHAGQARRMSEPPERVEDRRRREAAGEVLGQRLEMPDQVERLGFDWLRRKPAAEIRDGLDEIDIRPAAEIGRGRPRAAMLQAKPRKVSQGGDHVMRIVLRQGGDRIVGPRRSVQPPSEPLLEHGLERGFGLRRIEYARAGIDIGFDRVAADDGLAKRVDGRGGQLIELARGRGQARAAARRSGPSGRASRSGFGTRPARRSST